MRIYLDLLPEERKKEMEKNKIFLSLIYNEIVFTIPILVFIGILVAINFILVIKAEGVEKISTMGGSQKEYQELQEFENKFSEVNSRTMEVLKVQNKHINWLNVFVRINGAVPENVFISDLASADYQISLAGKAKTREDFLKFQENLKSEACFSNVSAPLSSLVSKKNVQFQINFEVKEDCLKNKIQ